MEKSMIFIILSLVVNPSISRSSQPSVSIEKRAEQPYYSKLKFATSILKELQKSEPGEDVFYSPQSAYRAFLLAYFSAAGETEKELENLLGISDWAKAKADAYKLEKDFYVQNATIEFTSINKIYVSNDINITNSAKKLFSNKFEQLDFFHKPTESIKHINQFIEEITKNNIRNFLKVDGTTQYIHLAIVNAAYFKGDWVTQFDPHHTRSGVFHKNDGKSVQVDMMSMMETFKHDLNTQVLRMSYKGSNERFSMYIFLPENTTTAIDELLSKLTAATLDDVFAGANMEFKNVEVKLPKFSIEKPSELAPVLERLGVRTLFDGSAIFSAFIEGERTYKTKLIHSAKIEVDEYGSLAATSFAFIGFFVSAAYGPEFICDHPFMFIIHDDESREIHLLVFTEHQK